jgi:hypothetical protein
MPAVVVRSRRKRDTDRQGSGWPNHNATNATWSFQRTKALRLDSNFLKKTPLCNQAKKWVASICIKPSESTEQTDYARACQSFRKICVLKYQLYMTATWLTITLMHEIQI